MKSNHFQTEETPKDAVGLDENEPQPINSKYLFENLTSRGIGQSAEAPVYGVDGLLCFPQPPDNGTEDGVGLMQ